MNTEAHELYAQLLSLPPAAREHLKRTITLLGRCYLEDADAIGILIVADETTLSVMPLGADIEEARDLLVGAKQTIDEIQAAQMPEDEHVH